MVESSNHLYRSVMDRYQKIEKNGAVGEGTYGVVYKGIDLWTKNYVALKRIRLETEDEGIPCTTLREIAVLRQLHHPCIVQLTDVVQQSWRLYLIFEFVDKDLKKYMDSKAGHLDAQEVRSFTYQMLKGIEYCHNRGVMHRDMKPQNLLVSKSGQLKIADFGLARAFVPPVRVFTHEVVTLWYRPPEILLGEKTYALPVDLWAVGTILAEMSNKRPLFPGDSEIDQLFKIFRVMGTPSGSNWVEGTQLPDFNPTWPKWPVLSVAKFAQRLDPAGVQLLEDLLQLDPRDRLSASEACEHPYFLDGTTIAMPADVGAALQYDCYTKTAGSTTVPVGASAAPVGGVEPATTDVTGKTAFAFANTTARHDENVENPPAKMAKGM